MRQLTLAISAVFMTAALASFLLLFAVSGARSQEASKPYSQVVDNGTPGRFDAPDWEVGSAAGQSYRGDHAFAEPSDGAEPARFKVNIPETGEYTVYARWPESDAHNVSTRFGVSTTSGVEWAEVDQQTNGGKWVSLGAYTLEAGDSWAVQVSRVDYFRELVVADAIKIVEGAQEGADGDLSIVSADDTMTAASTGGTGWKAYRSGRRFLGVKYAFGQCSIRRGMDCSCLTKVAFSRWRRLPDDPRRQFRYGRRIPKSNIKTGDLLFFNETRFPRGIDHVGMAAPRGQILHASTVCNHVCIKPRKWIMDDFVGAKRLLPPR